MSGILAGVLGGIAGGAKAYGEIADTKIEDRREAEKAAALEKRMKNMARFQAKLQKESMLEQRKYAESREAIKNKDARIAARVLAGEEKAPELVGELGGESYSVPEFDMAKDMTGQGLLALREKQHERRKEAKAEERADELLNIQKAEHSLKEEELQYKIDLLEEKAKKKPLTPKDEEMISEMVEDHVLSNMGFTWDEDLKGWFDSKQNRATKEQLNASNREAAKVASIITQRVNKGESVNAALKSTLYPKPKPTIDYSQSMTEQQAVESGGKVVGGKAYFETGKTDKNGKAIYVEVDLVQPSDAGEEPPPKGTGEKNTGILNPDNFDTVPSHDTTDTGYGKRNDGSEKDTGFLGEVPAPGGKVATEMSIGVNIGGQEVEIPLLVPGLTEEEIQAVVTAKNPADVPESIVKKAVEHAKKRIASGLSPFYSEKEKSNGLLEERRRRETQPGGYKQPEPETIDFTWPKRPRS